MKVLWILALVSILLGSCKKGELPIKKRIPGDVIHSAVNMETNYRYQLYFDLETNSMMQQNLKVDWDLGFESSETGWEVTLNSSKYMAAWNIGTTDFSVQTDTIGAQWQYDSPKGIAYGTAVGDWRNNTPVYIIDRGFNPSGIQLGFFKLRIDTVTANSYTLTTAELDGTNQQTIQLTKTAATNRICYHFDTGSIEIEPPKTEWDLHFTQYTHVYDDGITYLVNGVYLNPYGANIAQDSSIGFEAFKASDTSLVNLQYLQDEIGFDWKTYSFGVSGFIIHTEKNYIIRTSEKRYYKFHFVDFYDDQGNKGVPTFEFQEL